MPARAESTRTVPHDGPGSARRSRLALGFEVTATLARELIRAVAVPLHLAWFVVTRRGHVDRVAPLLRAGLDAQPADTAAAAAAARDRFAERATSRRGARDAHIFVSAGESSGEGHGAALIASIEQSGATPRWTCFGGDRLAAASPRATLAWPLARHAVMGIAAVLRVLPFFVSAYARYLRVLDEDRPDLVVLIDNPGLHVVMAAAARRRGVPVLHYVAPQYWAWGPWRLRRYRNAVDATLTILPFEPAYFSSAGLLSEYVGHPLLDQVAAVDRTTDDYRRAEQAASSRRTLCMLPGSRRKEIENHLRGMLHVARRLWAEDPDLQVVVLQRDDRRIERIRQMLVDERATDFVELVVGDPTPWLANAHTNLVKSGTGSLEACLHGRPTVVIYGVTGFVSRLFLRYGLTVPHFAGANLVAGKRIVPEFPIVEEADWDTVHAALRELGEDGDARREAESALAAMRERLGPPGASTRVARWIAPFAGSAGTEIADCSPSSPES